MLYRRYKQKDFNKTSFIIDILSFIVQNFNPIGLERKLELENDRVYVKMLWDICLSHAFTRYIYSKQHYDILSNPNLTFQKAYNIVKKYIAEDANNMNYLKIKVEENFKIIHFIYSSLYPKIYNRVNNVGIKIKVLLILFSQTGKRENKQERLVQKLRTSCWLQQKNC